MNRRISINNGNVGPQSFITKGKQRLKQHVDTVYLNNGDEFEIELYNPTQNKVLAQIELNGNSIGNGIVLRPGERVFLERHINEAKKFLFETYTVDGENQEVLTAIKNNGDVTVKFYNQYVQWIPTSWSTQPYYYGNLGTTLSTNSGTYYANGTTTVSDTNSTYTSTLSDSTVTTTASFNASPRSLETGRVEKGSSSNQSFTYDYTTFNSYPSWTNWWKLKPQSTKPLVKEDLVVYCTECGAKRKKDNHKFCPHCGTKF